MASVSTTSSSTTTSSTTSSTATAAASAAKQKNQFLNMLLTQLKSQNPTDAVDTKQMMSQLAQYSQLEQQIDTNTKLDSLVAASTSANVSPLSYLGTTVDYKGSVAPVQSEEATWNYSSVGASAVTLQISDASGKVLYTGAGDSSTGTHTLTLDSLTGVADGTQLTLKVTAKDAADKVVTTTVTARAKIDAVDTSSGTASLQASGYVIPTSSIVRIATTATTVKSV